MQRYSSQPEAVAIAEFLSGKIYELGNGHTGRVSWTDAVQLSLHEYTEDKRWEGAQVLPPFNFMVREQSRRDSFLLDFVVWRRDFPGVKEGAWIACESEWDLDIDSVIKDFQKLQSFQAPYKLMIYDVLADSKAGKTCRSEFERLMAMFQWHVEDEIYIFIEFIKGDAIANCYTCEPLRDAHLLKVL